jgi:hypothetical protein
MEESLIKKILEVVPGARRAANGVILKGDDGSELHLTNVMTSAETEGLTPGEVSFVPFCSKPEIIRLRSLKNSYDYLLRVRAHAIADSPRAVRVMVARKQKYTANGKPWSLSQFYHSKDYYHKSYIDRLASGNRKRLKGLPTGLAFVQEANAICLRSLLGELVIVSESLEFFYYFMSIAFYGEALSIPMQDRVNALLIAIRIMNGSEALDFELDPRGFLSEENERSLKELVFAQMGFTYGHEFSHYLLGHLDQPETNCLCVKGLFSQSESENIAVYDHDLEFQADANALKFISHEKKGHSLITSGAFSVLIYLKFLEDAQLSLGLRSFSVSSTHPKAIERVWQLHKSLGKKTSLTKHTIEQFIEASDFYLRLFIRHVQNARADILSFYGSIYLPTYMGKKRVDRIDF